MDAPRRIGEHLQHVVFRPRVVVRASRRCRARPRFSASGPRPRRRCSVRLAIGFAVVSGAFRARRRDTKARGRVNGLGRSGIPANVAGRARKLVRADRSREARNAIHHPRPNRPARQRRRSRHRRLFPDGAQVRQDRGRIGASRPRRGRARRQLHRHRAALRHRRRGRPGAQIDPARPGRGGDQGLHSSQRRMVVAASAWSRASTIRFASWAPITSTCSICMASRRTSTITR